MTAAGATLQSTAASSSAARRRRSDPVTRQRGTVGPRANWFIRVKLVCSGQLTPKSSYGAGLVKLVALPRRSARRTTRSSGAALACGETNTYIVRWNAVGSRSTGAYT